MWWLAVQVADILTEDRHQYVLENAKIEKPKASTEGFKTQSKSKTAVDFHGDFLKENVKFV